MKRIITSLLVVFSILITVSGATRAVFSASDSFVDNEINTAQVDIDARSEPRGLLEKPLIASGLVPGQWTDYARGVVYNTSLSTPVKVYMYLTNISGTACGKTNIEVWTGYANNGAASERDMMLMNDNVYTYNGAGNRVEITGTGKVFDPLLPINTSAVIQQRAQLDSSAGNGYQNTSCTWDEVFVAETPEY